ncbi:hypothetical protein TNCV_4000192 [Trichonephila clavipes]|nr:hypothetical protein TNCV_4000192 [Trichonephila clavipes]
MGRTFCWNGDRRSLSAGGTAAPLSCDLIGRSRSLAEYERCTIQLNSTQQFQFSASFKCKQELQYHTFHSLYKSEKKILNLCSERTKETGQRRFCCIKLQA